jgi:hypothetical protein
MAGRNKIMLDIERSISEEEFSEWLHNSTTRKVLAIMTELKTAYERQLIQGGTVTIDSVERTALLTATITGKIQGINELLELQPEIENKYE